MELAGGHASPTATPVDGTGGVGGMEDRIQAEHSHRWIRAERTQAAYRKGWNVADEDLPDLDAAERAIGEIARAALALTGVVPVAAATPGP